MWVFGDVVQERAGMNGSHTARRQHQLVRVVRERQETGHMLLDDRLVRLISSDKHRRLGAPMPCKLTPCGRCVLRQLSAVLPSSDLSFTNS